MQRDLWIILNHTSIRISSRRGEIFQIYMIAFFQSLLRDFHGACVSKAAVLSVSSPLAQLAIARLCALEIRILALL